MTQLVARIGWDALKARARALVGRGGERDTVVPVRDWVSVSAGRPTRLLGFDRTLVWVVVALLALGVVMVYSASIALPDNPKFARYAPTYFLTRQMISIFIGFIVALVALQVPIDQWERWSPWLFVATLLLLVLVLVPMIGKGVNGARRWIPLRRRGGAGLRPRSRSGTR